MVANTPHRQSFQSISTHKIPQADTAVSRLCVEKAIHRGTSNSCGTKWVLQSAAPAGLSQTRREQRSIGGVTSRVALPHQLRGLMLWPRGRLASR